MKKSIFKIVLVNIISIIIMILITEIFCFYKYKTFIHENKNNILKYTLPKKYSNTLSYRQFVTNKGSLTKGPIIFLGCSYTYGIGLSNFQTLAYKINQLTNRTTYKRGICGCGLKEILEQLENGKLKKDIPNAEYIIYTFINAHINRLYNFQELTTNTLLSLQYKITDGKLKKETKIKYPYLYSLFSVKLFQYYITNFLERKEYDREYPLFLIVMEECIKYFKEQYPNTKFVILLYPDTFYKDIEKGSREDIDSPILPLHIIEYLEDIGYIVINAEDLTEKPIRSLEYRIDDKDHPNEKAWDAIAPALVKKLNL